MRRGEIYLADLSNNVGSVQQGTRPVLIVQNDIGNQYSPVTMACPLTTRSKTPLATHVLLSPQDCGILKDSTVLCEQIICIDRQQIRKKLGEVDKEKMKIINEKLLISIGIEA